jgi:frataxin
VNILSHRLAPSKPHYITGASGRRNAAAHPEDKAEQKMTSLDDSSFTTLADDALAGLMQSIEDVLGDRADIDLRDGILTIDLDDGGCYVVNKHVPNRQIWLSSPFSGATHFAYDPEQGWIATRGGKTLHTLLGEEISTLTGTSVSLR